MKIDSLSVGPIGTNCYILQEEQAKLCAVIDPGDEPERIEALMATTGCAPVMILLTHGHFDHCTGVAGLLTKWPNLPVYIHEADVTDGSACDSDADVQTSCDEPLEAVPQIEVARKEAGYFTYPDND